MGQQILIEYPVSICSQTLPPLYQEKGVGTYLTLYLIYVRHHEMSPLWMQTPFNGFGLQLCIIDCQDANHSWSLDYMTSLTSDSEWQRHQSFPRWSLYSSRVFLLLSSLCIIESTHTVLHCSNNTITIWGVPCVQTMIQKDKKREENFRYVKNKFGGVVVSLCRRRSLPPDFRNYPLAALCTCWKL
jgi:hypothetical protein